VVVDSTTRPATATSRLLLLPAGPASSAAAAVWLALDTQQVRFNVPDTWSVAVNFDIVVL
jgi:hypothetical protein